MKNKMKKKMMLIVPMLHQGGFERVCITTARLMEPYYDVSIVVFNSANIAYDVTGLDIIDIQMGVKKGKLKKILNIFKRSRKVKQLKKEMQPEIAYSFGPTANLVNAFSKTKETKVWLGLRNYTDVEETGKIRVFIRKADKIICCARRIERELRQKFGFEETTTIYNLYDVDAIRREAAEKEPELPSGTEDATWLVSMGRDDDMKGFWHMLKVFACVQEQIPETRLMILGAGNYNQYRQLAKDLKINHKVFFAGMQKEPYKYVKKGQIYLLTSQNEGFPNALVEGMSLGLAAVSVDCMTGPSEILLEKDDTTAFERQKTEGEPQVIWGEYGVLLPAMEMEKNLRPEITAEEREMAKVVTQLLSDKALLEKYQQAAVERAQIFTYENYIREILKLAEWRA